MLFESLRKKYNRYFIGIYKKTAFGIDFGLWEVPKICLMVTVVLKNYSS